MGCKGSKHSSSSGADPAVVTPRKKSEVVKNKSVDVVPEMDVSGTGASDSVKEVTDITVNTEEVEGGLEKKEEEEKGKAISRDSPDNYFSSRKDEDAASVLGGEVCEYYSPPLSPTGKREGEAEEVLKVVEEKESAKEEEEEESKLTKEEKLIIKELADLKLPVVDEEAAPAPIKAQVTTDQITTLQAQAA